MSLMSSLQGSFLLICCLWIPTAIAFVVRGVPYHSNSNSNVNPAAFRHNGFGRPHHCLSPLAIQFPFSQITTTPSTVTVTCLEMVRRRGKLGSLVDAGESVAKTARMAPKKRSKRLNNKKKPTSGGTVMDGKKKEKVSTISPLLQQWASNQESSNDEEEEEGDEEGEYASSITTSATATSFEPFEATSDNNPKIKSNKRTGSSKKSLKQAQDEERKALVMSIVEELEEVLDTTTSNKDKPKKQTPDIDDILNPIRQLMALPNANTNLRQLIAGATRHDYRLAWVGSDAAVCHVGTGLHNVPLARLQEVFLSCVGKSRLEVLEVIRIIGPFPNVRNTLEGSCRIGKRNLVYGANNNINNINSDDDDDDDDDDSSSSERTVSELAITYDSMIDGTGKQITAGMENNARKINLHIAFCDENAIVAVVPKEDGSVRQDPVEENGANILFFAKEDVLDEKLDALRVL